MAGLRAHGLAGGMLGAAALLFAARVPAGPPARQDPTPILDRASASYDTVKTLQAEFTQIVDNPMIGDPDTTRGRLYQKRPNYFEMRFTDPKHDRIVADGRRLWLYTPSTTPNQVIRTAIPSTGTNGPHLIGQFVEHPRERYDARYLRSDSLPDGAVDVIALTPRAKRKGAAAELLSNAFRALPVPVIGRLRDGAFILDLRCLEDEAEFVGQLSSLNP